MAIESLAGRELIGRRQTEEPDYEHQPAAHGVRRPKRASPRSATSLHANAGARPRNSDQEFGIASPTARCWPAHTTRSGLGVDQVNARCDAYVVVE